MSTGTLLMRTLTMVWGVVLLPTGLMGQVLFEAPAPGLLSAAVGQVDVGGRLTAVSGDPARFQRMRDLRDGPVVERLRWSQSTDTWLWRATADHVGYRDQRYAATFDRYGKLKVSAEWNQVPLFYSMDTRTPYQQDSAGVFRLDNQVRADVQNRVGTTSSFIALARPFELRSRRDVAEVRMAYALSPRTDLRVSFTSTGRSGQQPWGASFGQTNAVEVAAPIDHRTNDMNATAEWSNERALARLAYDGSWFSNAVETLTFDNPLRLTDDPAAPAQGRMALWPDSTAHTVSAAGSIAFPGRSRAFAHVSLGNWLQDQQLLPHTINTAIAPVPLARTSAEARAQILSVVSRVTSRPVSSVWLNAQYRLYDYDNRTPVFPLTQYVRVDSGTASSLTGGSEPFGYTRQFADVDASYSPTRRAAFRVGYGVERDNRTFRFLDETTEHTLRAAVDSTGLTWGSVRLQYEHAVRTGTGLDEEVFSDIGEQVSLRQFDISDRTRDRVTALVQVVPTSVVGFHATAAVGLDSRPGAAFGLQNNDLRSVAFGVDVTPGEAMTLGATVGLENYSTLQRSRQANPGPQFLDPTRDWATDVNEDVRTFTGSMELPKLTSRASARFAYDAVLSRARYRYDVPADSTLAPPQQLLPVRNDIHRVTADVRVALTRALGLGIGYAYERYAVDDFALSPSTLDRPVFPTLLSLMYQWRPYWAHTGSVRLQYRF